MTSAELWSVLLGAMIGSLMTAAVGGVYMASKLAGFKVELEGLRRDVNRLTGIIDGRED